MSAGRDYVFDTWRDTNVAPFVGDGRCWGIPYEKYLGKYLGVTQDPWKKPNMSTWYQFEYGIINAGGLGKGEDVIGKGRGLEGCVWPPLVEMVVEVPCPGMPPLPLEAGTTESKGLPAGKVIVRHRAPPGSAESLAQARKEWAGLQRQAYGHGSRSNRKKSRKTRKNRRNNW